ncbi:DUF2235 domain-containing protein [Chryseobacterium sp. SSA4.19]|uniref:phospholipase effector Tle1 domain-containing protein n=1 Tax=Chryseobacterium sp. SSA4.19 TaxID=2919915 RepID=UPI001F4D7DF8|nr:DUF2235 domain-containing protein [Chryseobacterium sp. SSA4.19]MCJ8154848.1 DUF2235 domain-containing protein [Chryseobacterium sp. SSA4.19]
MGKTFVYNTGNAISPIDQLHLEVGVFFDGTLNNLKNTELRQKYKDGKNKIESTDSDEEVLQKEKAISSTTEQQESEYEKLKTKKHPGSGSEYEQYLKAIHRTSIDKRGVDNSFSNDFTNVARLYTCCEQNDYAIYVEGIGTVDNRRDVDDGFQYGSGFTGVRGKVRLGCEKLADRIKNSITKGSNSDKQLKKISIDTFGFSRGAAAARNFSYEINGNKRAEDIEIKTAKKLVGYRNSRSYGNDGVIPEYETVWIDKDKTEVDPDFLVDGKLPKYGFLGYYLLSKDILTREELDILELEVRFIGVYDTVSSYEEFGDMGAVERVGLKGAIHSAMGPSHYFGNDVEQLQLKNPGPFLKAVHFTALDEHRENFSLTRFPGSLEKEFPGVHCDIGGAYENGMETVDEIETSNHKPLWFLNDRRQHLIDEHWFTDEQIEINNKIWSALTFGTVYRKITGKRFLRKEYSYIPLHFMGEHGNRYFDHQLMNKNILEISYSIEHDTYLPSAKNYLYHYVFENGERWNFKTDEQVKLERELKEAERLKEEIPAAVIDHVYVKPPLEVPVLLPGSEQNRGDKNGNEMKTVDLEEVTVTGYSEQTLLRILRNRYLHWSANRDWLGMDPNSDYKRRVY